MQRILIIEDEPSIQSILRELLTDNGYAVDVAGDGVEGLTLFKGHTYDLVMLDIMMPRMDGFTVCRAIRRDSKTPIIMLTALDEEEAQVKAFELQIDDYITKPFSIKLVLLRVEAVLRRTAAPDSEKFSWGEVSLDSAAMDITVAGERVLLTRLEFELLQLFMRYPRRVFSREQLISSIWGYDFVGDEKAVNIHIMNIRRKLGVDCIESVRGVGYRLAKN